MTSALTESPREGVFSPRHRAVTVGILLSITVVAIEGMAVATVMPSVANELGGLEAYGWAFSAFMLASLVGSIAAGELSDRGGLSRPAIIGYICFSLGLAMASAAPAWLVLLAARAVQGFGAGCVTAVAFVAVARAYPESLRPRLLALLSSAWIVPALVGPAIAGQVAEHFTWRLVFVGILPPTGIGAGMLLPSLTRLPGASASGQSASSHRLFAALRLTAGVGLILSVPNLPLWQLAPFAIGLGILLAAPALQTLLPPRTFTLARGLPSSIALRGLLAFGFFGTEALIPLGLSTQRDLPPTIVGLSLTTGALAWVLASWVQDRAEAFSSGSLGLRAVRAVVGLVLIVGGIAGVAAVILSPTAPVLVATLSWGVAGLGMGLAYPATTLTALGLASPGAEGSAAASLQVAETIGIAVGTGAVGALFAAATYLARAPSDGLLWGFLVTVALSACAIAPGWRIAPSGSTGNWHIGARVRYVGRAARRRSASAILLRKGHSTQ